MLFQGSNIDAYPNLNGTPVEAMRNYYNSIRPIATGLRDGASRVVFQPNFTRNSSGLSSGSHISFNFRSAIAKLYRVSLITHCILWNCPLFRSIHKQSLDRGKQISGYLFVFLFCWFGSRSESLRFLVFGRWQLE